MPALVSARFLVPACLALTVSRYRETEPAPLRPRARCRREPLRSATNLAADLPAPGKAQAACDLDQDTLEAHRQIPGQDQPETMANASNLAADLITDGEVRELTHRSAAHQARASPRRSRRLQHLPKPANARAYQGHPGHLSDPARATMMPGGLMRDS